MLDTPSLARKCEGCLLVQRATELLHERRQPLEPKILGHVFRNTCELNINLLFISVMIYMANSQFRNVGTLSLIQRETAIC